jgi:TolB protein
MVPVVALAALTAHAQLDVTVTSGNREPIAAAFVPFGWQGTGAAVPFDIAALVEQDLENSGYFAGLERRNMISQPTQATQINFQDWRIQDVDILLIGQLSQAGQDQYQISFQLFDVTRAEQLLAFRVASTGPELRATSHRISDMIYEEMTGIRGIFSTRIAYITETRTNLQDRMFRLVVADADGANAATVAESRQPLMSPAWAPDGRSIAYVSFEGDQSGIYVQTLRTGTRTRVSARVGINGAPVYSPDGRMLALALSQGEGNLDIYTLDLATQVLRRITENSAIDTDPEWSRDGEWLYFTSDRAGAAQIYRVPAVPNGQAQRVTFDGRYNADPRVNPDGDRLAIVHRGENQDQDRIALLDPSNGEIFVLSRGSLDESPSFAPNGALIIYATRDRGQGVLASVSTDGQIHQRIASPAGADVREPVWSPFPRP